MRHWWDRKRRADREAHPDVDPLVMRRQLDALLKLATSWGMKVESLAPDAVPDVPIGLLAASRVHSQPGGEPVLLSTEDGREVIAVIDGAGSPDLWWSEIKARAALS